MGRTPSPAVPAAAAVLFALWIGFLGYLAWTTRRPVVLSRPQVLVAPLVVLADVHSPEDAPVVRRVAFSLPHAPPPADGSPIDVVNLDARIDGWIGPGRYILPLAPVPGTRAYRVVDVPKSPGFPGAPARIYPATPQAEQSLTQLLAEFHG